MNTDKRLLDQLKDNLDLQSMQSLDDPEVVEIMLNPDGRLWIEKIGRDILLDSKRWNHIRILA